MKIEIKSRLTGDVLVSGDYENLRDACEQNKSNLRYSDLRAVI